MEKFHFSQLPPRPLWPVRNVANVDAEPYPLSVGTTNLDSTVFSRVPEKRSQEEVYTTAAPSGLPDAGARRARRTMRGQNWVTVGDEHCGYEA
jgi:hypothetical protein